MLISQGISQYIKQSSQLYFYCWNIDKVGKNNQHYETSSLCLNMLNIYFCVTSDGRDEAEEPEAGGEDVARDAGQGGYRGGGEGGSGRIHQDTGV